ncbi:glucosamine/fructose-6-phosphate aminotransferase, isomerizing [Anaeromyxobacter dehalogenans 2CP-1]|uniref:Glutamine--fructose-6-phosphate aminotransferase [isomerizing] n=1 Tax=Anaeromyxobacter dehalogenans (strain ATCC BAA-258 / DSM 21875 / 2CP-1) TaxID=455488 RepID=B8J9N2_ANAD2|nr:glutamine--fructose-6-phosphate transaminase (isomerizing) [Anaeromyxobacter dehalogenans]ACL67420.1 glucosamine/fructose-6-phosphate aminotransferase, isomerizing [Anaeromyxobacter dehalogenans 2CP-1]
MCGIVGYVGPRQCVDLIVGGLRKLEYRGYDSAGVAVVGPNGLAVKRAKGKLQNLVALLADAPLAGTTGIGHTRWATHGKPSDENAHPHCYGGVAVVHNGIIENHLELKAALAARGHKFSSETDTEIFAHLIADALAAGARDLRAAVGQALAQVKGTYAIAVVSQQRPEEIVAAKNASPLVVGYGKGESFLASDVPAILEHTREVVYLEEGELAVLTPAGIALYGRDGEPLARKPRKIEWSAVAAEKDGHKHFMHKEIFEQPRAVADTIRGRASLEQGDVALDGMELPADYARSLERIVIVACGTSWHAGLSGRQMIESLARVPVEVELASEFRNRDPLVDERVLCLAISQSGETADTLAAVKIARARGARAYAICNVVGSAISRECDGGTLFTRAGPEIGVASTKAFTTQLAALFLMAVRLGRLRGTLSPERARELLEDLRRVPSWMEQMIRQEAQLMPIAKRCAAARDVLFLGRGSEYPVALEGALKLKEISYIHAEGYAAGEMKHGPIALIDEELPVVVLATREPAYEKTLGNMEEVRARGGQVFAVVTEGDTHAASLAEVAITVPPAPPVLVPLLSIIPLQFLAYHVADLKGTDVDQPRNLAKSVTVE